MSYMRKTNPYNPGYAIPKNALEEPALRGTITSKQAPRGTIAEKEYHSVVPWHPGYKIPQNVADEPLDTNPLVSKWDKRGTIASMQPSWLVSGPAAVQSGALTPVGSLAGSSFQGNVFSRKKTTLGRSRTTLGTRRPFELGDVVVHEHIPVRSSSGAVIPGLTINGSTGLPLTQGKITLSKADFERLLPKEYKLWKAQGQVTYDGTRPYAIRDHRWFTYSYTGKLNADFKPSDGAIEIAAKATTDAVKKLSSVAKAAICKAHDIGGPALDAVGAAYGVPPGSAGLLCDKSAPPPPPPKLPIVPIAIGAGALLLVLMMGKKKTP